MSMGTSELGSGDCTTALRLFTLHPRDGSDVHFLLLTRNSSVEVRRNAPVKKP